MVAIDDASLRQGMRISVLYCFVFTFTIIAQTYRKFQEKMKFKAEGKRFVRWDPTNSRMLAADRAVGNFMEWGPVFLILFWCNIFAVGASSSVVYAAWMWLVARLFYAILTIFMGSYSVGGPRVTIFLSTVPGYAALILLMIPLLPMLWQ